MNRFNYTYDWDYFDEQYYLNTFSNQKLANIMVMSEYWFVQLNEKIINGSVLDPYLKNVTKRTNRHIVLLLPVNLKDKPQYVDEYLSKYGYERKANLTVMR